eukprot:4728473-Ditylum_brightwellii.AAC.1
MIRSFEVHDTSIDEKDTRTGILSAVRFATRVTVHTTMQATPMQLVFSRDAILNVKHVTNWKYIQERKDKIIMKNNENENKRRKLHQYKVAGKVLVKGDKSTKYRDYAYKGPYRIVQVNNNETFKIKKGS